MSLAKIRERPPRATTWFCSYCGKNIMPDSMSTDARIHGTFHPGCQFKALKRENPHYRKAT